jgi:hypothetical protein
MTAGETTPIPTFPLRGKENLLFPLRGKEGSFLRAAKHSLPLRGRARVGVVRLLRLILLGALRRRDVVIAVEFIREKTA